MNHLAGAMTTYLCSSILAVLNGALSVFFVIRFTYLHESSRHGDALELTLRFLAVAGTIFLVGIALAAFSSGRKIRCLCHHASPLIALLIVVAVDSLSGEPSSRVDVNEERQRHLHDEARTEVMGNDSPIAIEETSAKRYRGDSTLWRQHVGVWPAVLEYACDNLGNRAVSGTVRELKSAWRP